jgi:GNAT superfamily N-acetyltransferase
MLIIRSATQADSIAISALISQVSHYFFALPDGAGAERFVASTTPQGILEFMGRPNVCYLVAENQGIFCGAIALRDNKHLQHLFVRPEFHRQGIAKKLWETAKHRVLSTNSSGEFTVNASLNAVSVYEKFGFVSNGPITKSNGVIFQAMKLTLAVEPAKATPVR